MLVVLDVIVTREWTVDAFVGTVLRHVLMVRFVHLLLHFDLLLAVFVTYDAYIAVVLQSAVAL